jgi:FkbM family methyltransferase
MTDGRLRVFNLALGDTNTVATLHQNFVEDTNSLLHNSPGSERFAPESWMTPVGSTEVRVARLDEVFREQSLERIDVLKIDAQGYERRILEGAGALLDTKAIRGRCWKSCSCRTTKGRPGAEN